MVLASGVGLVVRVKDSQTQLTPLLVQGFRCSCLSCKVQDVTTQILTPSGMHRPLCVNEQEETPSLSARSTCEMEGCPNLIGRCTSNA